MIIRRPYAFLIKYFKIIHIIVFLLMLYLTFSTQTIYNFFKNYLVKGTYTYIDNMALSYVNPFMIISTILLITAYIFIYFLMKKKEKKVLYYLLGIIFYFLYFIILIIFLGTFNQLEYTSLSNQTLVIYRDFAMVLYYLNFFFMAIAFVRGFGFNIKKFNFEKDLKELDIKEEDREEIEVGGNLDFENVGNFVRRRKRNFIYYLKENSFVLIIFSTIAVLLTTMIVAINKLVINKVYKVGESINIDSIEYKITGSYMTDKDLYGNIIKNNKKYLIVTFDVKNNGENSLKLSYQDTRVKVINNYYYPKVNLYNKFDDFGTIYRRQNILSNSSNSYIFVFEIDNYANKATLQLYRGKSENNGEVTMYYKDVTLNPYIFKNNDLGKYKINDKISLKNTYYEKGEFAINSLELLDIENYTYANCKSENDCVDEKITIVPKGIKKLLKIKYSEGTPKNIFNYLNIEGARYSSSSDIDDVTPDNYESNTALLEVPSNISLDNIVLYFNIRGSKIRISNSFF